MAHSMQRQEAMNTTRSTLALLVALSFVSAPDLVAQRRTSDGGGGGGGRSAPASSGGGGSAASAPSRGRDGGGSGPTYSRGGGSGSSGSGSVTRGTPQGSSASPTRGTSVASGTTASGSSGRPQSGKIGEIKRQAQAARAARPVGGGGGVFIGTCWGCDYWGWYGDRWGWYHGGWWYPAYYPPPDYYPGNPDYAGGSGNVPGYDAYPYADSTAATFARRNAPERRAYGTLSLTYFNDRGSTTQAGQVALEGVFGRVRTELEYGHYAEPVVGHTDHLQTLRLGVGGQPRLGNNAYLIAGLAARGVFLDDGSHAWGPEGELGVQAFPVRPFGVNVTGRLASLSWNGSDYFTFQELNTTGSVFVNRVELQAGWHWMKVGSSPAFGGPVLGMRLWF